MAWNTPSSIPFSLTNAERPTSQWISFSILQAASARLISSSLIGYAARLALAAFHVRPSAIHEEFGKSGRDPAEAPNM
eukprot:9487198-Pyramimonas_sp.AAC.2